MAAYISASVSILSGAAMRASAINCAYDILGFSSSEADGVTGGVTFSLELKVKLNFYGGKNVTALAFRYSFNWLKIK